MDFITTNHRIKYSKNSNDEFYTPIALAKKCIQFTPFCDGDSLFDSAYGKGVFYHNFPESNPKGYSTDFFYEDTSWDWIITNPPYSILDDWFRQTIALSNKGFGLLLGWNNLTARRIKMCNDAGFGLSKILMFKVFKWFGMSCFVVFEKGKDNIIDIDRKVWREVEN